MRGRWEKRFAKLRNDGEGYEPFKFTKDDIIGPDPSLALLNCQAWNELQELISLKATEESVKSILDISKFIYDRELKGYRPIDLTLNRVFLGSPGANTKAILASTVGKVLIIHEAYMLYTGGAKGSNDTDSFKTAVCRIHTGHFPSTDVSQVIESIVAEVQDTTGDDRCVLLLGYTWEMMEMFRNVNPGLEKRFQISERFTFRGFL